MPCADAGVVDQDVDAVPVGGDFIGQGAHLVEFGVWSVSSMTRKSVAC